MSYLIGQLAAANPNGVVLRLGFQTGAYLHTHHIRRGDGVESANADVAIVTLEVTCFEKTSGASAGKQHSTHVLGAHPGHRTGHAIRDTSLGVNSTPA